MSTYFIYERKNDLENQQLDEVDGRFADAVNLAKEWIDCLTGSGIIEIYEEDMIGEKILVKEICFG